MKPKSLNPNEFLSSCIENSSLDNIKLKHMPTLEVTEKQKDDINYFSSLMNIMDDEKLTKKSLLLFARHYPSYHHYSYKITGMKQYPKFPKTYAVLPEIKGHTLDHKVLGNGETKIIHNEISNKVSTLQDLKKYILQYGAKTDVVWMKFANSRNGHRLVRPGFSARRYMVNLVRNLNDSLVQKLIADGKILEKTLFRNGILLPHIRRRLSSDLSRYPEPYRILKQMFISPGPLNEYSFIWKNPSYFSEDSSSLEQIPNLIKGEIKILTKKTDSADKDELEEVQYSKMSHDTKKTVLTNILLKSAMNQALKMNEEIVESNLQRVNKTKAKVYNVPVPVITFNMVQAVTELVNKETMETMSANEMKSLGTGSFKGQALRSSSSKSPRHSDLGTQVIVEGKEYEGVESNQFNMNKNKIGLPLNLSNVANLDKKELLDIKVTSGKQSPMSNGSFDSSFSYVMPEHPSPKNVELKSNMELQNNKTLKELTISKETIMEPGISKDKTLNENEDIENVYQDRDLLILLLREHVETVAEKVFRDPGSGEDFTSDVNVAITEILSQRNSLIDENKDVNNVPWDLNFEDIRNPGEYDGMIKDIFKSLFQDQLSNVDNDNIDIDADILSLLQNGIKLEMENFEIQKDSSNGRIIIKLKDESAIKTTMGNMSRSLNMDSGGIEDFQHIDRGLFHTIKSNAQSKSFDVKKKIGELNGTKNDHFLPYLSKSNEINSEVNGSEILRFGNPSHNLPEISESSLTVKITEMNNGNINIKEESVRFFSDNSIPILSQKENKIDTSVSDILTDKKVNIPKKKGKFITGGYVDDSKNFKGLYSGPQEKVVQKQKSPKQSVEKTVEKASKKKKNIETKKTKKSKMEKEIKLEKDENDNANEIQFQNAYGQKIDSEIMMEKLSDESLSDGDESSTNLLRPPIAKAAAEDLENVEEEIIEEDVSEDNEEDENQKLLLRKQREAKRNAGAEKKRLEVEMRRKEKEEQRKAENKRREMEEILAQKLEDERKRKEEELILKREKEKEEEILREEALKNQEYLKQKKLEKAKKEKEEFKRKLEEMKMKHELEEQKRKEEQERLAFEESERIRIENEIMSRMQEKDRLEFLRKKAEESERKRIQEEEEKRLKEEQAQLALEEARRVLQQQARERALLEARLKFVEGLKIESEGLKKYLNVSPAFIWSYFEFLKILGLQSNIPPNGLDSTKS